MGFLFSLAVETGLAAVLLLPVFILLHRTAFRDRKRSILYYLLAVYLGAVYTQVGLPNVTYIRFELNLNLLPLVGIPEDLRSSLLNVVLFMPLGFMLPQLWRHFCFGRKTALFGFGMSLAIELLQIFTYRATDVNDLITNTFGTLLGWWLWRAVGKNLPAGRTGKTGEGYLIFAVTAAVMFFVHPFLSNYVWYQIL